MKPIATILTCLVLLFSCKKKETSFTPDSTPKQMEPKRDFMFIPMKDAKWEVRYAGSYVRDSTPIGYHYDTSKKYYITIVALGKDTFFNDLHYHLFSETSTGLSNGNSIFYLREDTSKKKLFYATIERKGSSGYELQEWMLADYDVRIGGLVGAKMVTVIDSFLMNGIYLRRWKSDAKVYDFLQAYGIGGKLGLYSGYDPADGAIYQGLTFYYKADSFRLE